MNSHDLAAEAVPLPQRTKTRDGFEFDPRPDSWLIGSLQSRSVKFEFGDLQGVTPSLVHRLKLTVLDLLEKQSFSHGFNLWGRFREFHRGVLSIGHLYDAIDLGSLVNFRVSLGPTTVWKLGAVRVLLERGQTLGYDLLTEEAARYLRDAVIPGNIKGNDVRLRDPERGAFTTNELEQLNSALNDAYVRGTVDLPDYALCHVMLAYGTRAKQIAALKVGDLVVASAKDGSKVYTLRIPRAKQRGELIRASFTERACDRRLGELLERLIKETAIWAGDPTIPEVADRALFTARQHGDLPGFAYHRTAKEITTRLQEIFESVAPLHANSKRFRHTLAKRAHDDGADIYVIAELLDHVDTQNAKIYTEGSADIVDRLNRTMAMELAPVAQAFAGLLITRDDIEAHDAGKAKRIHDRALPDGKGADPLGNCGIHGFCGLARPIACYTCRNFRPWEDGPHEQVLSGLLEHREAQQAKGFAPRIYGLHDRTITAVARVVQLCEERRGPQETVAA